jgi:hypothetical protein
LRGLACSVSGQNGGRGFANAARLGIRDHLHLEAVATNEFRSALNALSYRMNGVIMAAAQTEMAGAE